MSTTAEPRLGVFRRLILPLILLLAAAVVFAYPVVGTLANNASAAAFAQRYSLQAAELGSQGRQKALEEARAYNESLTGVPILDPYLSKVKTEKTEGYKKYLQALGQTEVMGRVRVPSVGIDLPIRHGTGEDAIATGAGHLYGTALPIGGEGNRSVLTAHTAMPNATLFDNLVDAEVGDLVHVDVMGQTVTYQIHERVIVEPHEVSRLVAEPGEDLLTLFTCYPYAENTHRLLVTGHRVQTPESARVGGSSAAHIPIQPWMWACLGGSALCLVAGVGLTVSDLRKGRRSQE